MSDIFQPGNDVFLKHLDCLQYYRPQYILTGLHEHPTPTLFYSTDLNLGLDRVYPFEFNESILKPEYFQTGNIFESGITIKNRIATCSNWFYYMKHIPCAI